MRIMNINMSTAFIFDFVYFIWFECDDSKLKYVQEKKKH